MMRFQRVREVLDEAVGGPDAPVGVHGAFWRDATREQFVTTKVVGKPLLMVGDGAGSNLVRALRGEKPFGAVGARGVRVGRKTGRSDRWRMHLDATRAAMPIRSAGPRG